MVTTKELIEIMKRRLDSVRFYKWFNGYIINRNGNLI